jgi:hypothetical protein
MLLQKNQLKAPLTASIDALKNTRRELPENLDSNFIRLFSIHFFIGQAR